MQASTPNTSGDKRSGRFDHMAGLDAVGAYNDAFGLTVLKCSNRLQIGVEASFVNIVRMANIVANHWFLPANLTFFGHF